MLLNATSEINMKFATCFRKIFYENSSNCNWNKTNHKSICFRNCGAFSSVSALSPTPTFHFTMKTCSVWIAPKHYQQKTISVPVKWKIFPSYVIVRFCRGAYVSGSFTCTFFVQTIMKRLKWRKLKHIYDHDAKTLLFFYVLMAILTFRCRWLTESAEFLCIVNENVRPLASIDALICIP